MAAASMATRAAHATNLRVIIPRVVTARKADKVVTARDAAIRAATAPKATCRAADLTTKKWVPAEDLRAAMAVVLRITTSLPTKADRRAVRVEVLPVAVTTTMTMVHLLPVAAMAITMNINRYKF